MELKIILPIILSVSALVLSGLTFWLTFFWGGKLKFTKPSHIMLFYTDDQKTIPVIYTLFYAHSTGLAGNIIRGMFVKVSRGDIHTNFSDWSVKSGNDYTVLAGIKIMRDGANLESSFLISDRNFTGFFNSGEYRLELYYKNQKSETPSKAWTISLPISETNLSEINNGKILSFNLSAGEDKYIPFVREKGISRDIQQIDRMVEKMSEKFVGKDK